MANDITINLTGEAAAKLHELAKRAQMSPDEMVKIWIAQRWEGVTIEVHEMFDRLLGGAIRDPVFVARSGDGLIIVSRIAEVSDVLEDFLSEVEGPPDASHEAI